MKLKLALIGVIAAVAAGVAGCSEGGQGGALREAEQLCASHGGVGFLNFDYDKIDEVRCRDSEENVQPQEVP